ncbi:hypothetical protein IQ250_04550 [Pseudanabaenaceae cyanobacterium LEGE 13415]|nr:hypothetical protein [Pseudanabaenaceae cyanobacterium LEGE 13415]
MQTTDQQIEYSPVEKILRTVLKRSGYLWFDRPTAALRDLSLDDLRQVAISLRTKDDRIVVTDSYVAFQGREPVSASQSPVGFWERNA